jgi:hypothetical protein
VAPDGETITDVTNDKRYNNNRKNGKNKRFVETGMYAIGKFCSELIICHHYSSQV